MGGKEHNGPTGSSALLPLAKQLRRASVSSIASLFDKNAINQTLDQIHSSASQSDSLTTFSDYAPPPSSSSTSEPKKQVRSSSPAGIGSWYSRVRGSTAQKGVLREGKSGASNVKAGAPDRAEGPGDGKIAKVHVEVKPADDSVAAKTPASAGPTLHRLSSRQSEASKAADPAGSSGGLERVVVHNPLVSSTRNSSHNHTVSNSSRNSTAPGNDSRQDALGGHQILKRSRTPDPSTPASPLVPSEDVSSRKAASISLAKTPSRAASVSSANSLPQRRDDLAATTAAATTTTASHKDLLGSELSPKLSRFSSILEAQRKNVSQDSSAFSDLTEESEGSQRLESTKPRKQVSQNDAMAALRRLQDQGLSSAVASSAQTNSMSNTLTQLKNRVLSRQYWMKDENARDCFYCGDSFSTFRRKHHCRTCGQIFDAKCTTLVSGSSFGQSGTIRVCKPCEGVINGYDDSSDYTDDDTASVMTGGFRRRHNSKDNGDTSPTRPSTPNIPGFRGHDYQYHPRSNLNNFKAHFPGALGRRVIDDLKRTSGHYDDDAERRSIRPMSSRSLKSSHGMRPHVTGHRRHHSKHLLQRASRNLDEERAPFYQHADQSQTSGDKLPAFHSDNVIDPDLAAYLSDDGDSEDDEQSIAAALHGSKVLPHSPGGVAAPLTPLQKRPHSRYGDRLLPSRRSEADLDSISISSRSNALGHLRRRNVSFTGSALLVGSPPKPQRLSVAAHQWSSPSIDGILPAADGTATNGLIVRSASLQGAGAPAVELNNASLQHGRRLLRQMLEESSIPDVDIWEKSLMPIMLRATDDVCPNIQQGDAINITNYVKLKKVQGGSPGDTAYVSGVVFSKNIALKSMPRTIANPNILILTFAIEYSRHEQHFMSLEPVIRQEREYLQNLVNRIAAVKPQLVLVQRNVSGLALNMLDKAKIAVAHNVKRSVLEAISRCCQSRIITSMDKLASLADSHSMCETFSLRSFVDQGKRKTYMYLSGCPKELGCTVVLRGSNVSVLRRVKRIAEFMLQAIYNLRLETSFMRDEFALIPHYGAEGTIRYHDQAQTSTASTTSSAGVKAHVEGDIVRDRGLSVDQTEKPKDEAQIERENAKILQGQPATEGGDGTTADTADDIPAPTFYSDLVDKQRTRIISTSPFVKFMQPYLLQCARESESKLMHLKKLLDQDAQELALAKEVEFDKFSLITPEMINETVKGASRQVREILQAVHESEYDKAINIYQTQAKQWENSVVGNADMFNPLSHQSITVLHTLVCKSLGIACSGPDLFTIRFYDDQSHEQNVEPDCTLGQYVEDTCLSAEAVCGINGCQKKLHEHERHYVHGEGMVNVTIERSPSKAPGLENVLLMWSVCRKCGKETQTMPMSNNTWNYSFGKYLELAFWSMPLRPRADICPHELHRDHWRYFGYQNWAIRLQYDAVNLLEVVVPRTRITWKVVNDLKFKNENFKRVERQLNKFVTSVKDRLRSVHFDTIVQEKIEECREEVDRLTTRINKDYQIVHTKLQEKYVNSKFYEIVPFNRALRMLHEKAGEWDLLFQEFEANYFPSEKDIRRLATLQIKKMFLDNEEAGSSLTSPDGTTNTSFAEDLSEDVQETDLSSPSSSRVLSPEKAHDLMASVIEDNAKGVQPDLEDEISKALPASDAADTTLTEADPTSPTLKHLDLAVSPPLSPKVPSSPAPVQNPITPESIPESSKERTLVKEGSSLHSARPSLDSTAESLPTDSDTPIHAKKRPKVSAIPRFTDFARRRSKIDMPSSPQRSQSQPGNGRSILRGLGSQTTTPQRSPVTATFDNTNAAAVKDTSSTQKKLSQRFSLAGMKEKGQSFIPRSITSKRSTRVSALTKHFEQLSEEFEKLRLNEQKQRALRYRQAGAYPAAALKPIVEVYQTVNEAMNEGDDDTINTRADDSRPESQNESKPGLDTENLVRDVLTGKTQRARFADQLVDESQDSQDASLKSSFEEGRTSEAQASKETLEDYDEEKQDDVAPAGDDEEQDADAEEEYDYDVDLPKHEKTSLMKMLTNFWAERSSSGWEPLHYPLRDIDHVFANSDIIVREDEPSSLIALALDHDDYQAQIRRIEDHSANASILEEKGYVEDLFLTAEEQRSIERSLVQDTGRHLSYQFERGSAKMQCKIFWAEQFEAVRKKCGVSERVVESLSRCLKWDSKGGKTKAAFLKTTDDRFVLKALSPVEVRSFLRFAPFYFTLMGQALFHELPSLIAKLLGFYQVTIKNPATGTDLDWYLLLMENLFYDRTPKHTFDLKGSMRNRRITPSGDQNEVLLDENMVDYIAEHPLFAREHSKKLLRFSIYNDTLFLERRNVMDYSLMLAIDERDGRTELVVGIIDCIRTYTWDKKLETWVKDRGKNRPTVTEPKDYKKRFREAINRYVMEAPTCWHVPGAAGAPGRGGLRRGETSMTEREEDIAGALGEPMTADEGG